MHIPQNQPVAGYFCNTLKSNRMKVILVVAIVLFLYFFLSYLVYQRLIKVRWVGFFAISAVYLIFTYLLFFLVIGLVYDRFSDSFYKDSIPADKIILATFFVCSFTGLINVIAAMAGKEAYHQQAGANQVPDLRKPKQKRIIKALASTST
jgi:hypothetical protein